MNLRTIQDNFVVQAINMEKVPNSGTTRTKTTETVTIRTMFCDANQTRHIRNDCNNVKLPTFYVDNVDLWFWQVESAFIAADIRSDAKKYHTIISQLPLAVIMQVADYRPNPPPIGRMYQQLKKTIVKINADNERTKIMESFKKTPLVNRKPSQLLDDMRTNADTSMVEYFHQHV